MRFRVYIEGVEVPFETASIRSVYRELPEATITMPPYQGMEQLGRNYFPKLHIFYLDPNEAVMDYKAAGDSSAKNGQVFKELSTLGYSEAEIKNMSIENRTEVLQRSGYKLIFTGVINGCMESKQMTAGGASQMISLQAVHPYYVLREVLLKYVGMSLTPNGDTNNKLNVATSSFVNQPTAIIRALHGIRNGGPSIEEADGDGVFGLSKAYADRYERLKGCPGSIVVLWNMLKRDVLYRGLQTNNCESFKEMYIPLIEEGLKFFSRMTGHSVIEEALQTGKTEVEPNADATKGTQEEDFVPTSVILPPPFRTFVSEGATLQLAVQQTMDKLFGGDQQATSYYDIINGMLGLMEYDMLVLNSPARLVSNGGEIIESVIKPHMPYYYAPICNVILPNLYDSFSIQHNSASIPTRIIVPDTIVQNVGSNLPNSMNMSYVSPHSVRLGISNDKTLKGTLFPMNNKVGQFEWGTGIRGQIGTVPDWYSYYAGDAAAEGSADVTPSDPAGLAKAIATWNAVYPGVPGMNPWDVGASGIVPYQSVLFRQADFNHTNVYAGSRVATVSGVFNPYIIVGYPMDVLDPSPMRSSYHGFCTSVSHEINAAGDSRTIIGMAACLSYEELASCYVPLTSPWLSMTLKFTEDTRIFNNRAAYEVACQYYSTVLGVGAADPFFLVNYELGKAVPVSRRGGVWTQGVELDHTDALPGRSPWYSVQGSLNLVARNIMTLTQVEADHADVPGRTFIDIAMWNVGTIKSIKEKRTDILQPEDVVGSALKLGVEMERSAFLDYPDVNKKDGAK